MNYILDNDGNAIPVDTLTWARWFETADRKLARTEISPAIRVSTVFVGAGDSIWETLIFGGAHDGEGQQYASRDAALVGHELWVIVAKGETTPEAIDEMEAALL